MKSKTIGNLIITLALISIFVILADKCDFFSQLATITLLKSELGEITGQTDSALHAYFGVAIFCFVAMVFRKQFQSMMPWIIVCGVELLNEFLDMLISISSRGHLRWGNRLSDILYTIAIPSTVFVIARLYHHLSQKVASPVLNHGPTAVLSIPDNA